MFENPTHITPKPIWAAIINPAAGKGKLMGKWNKWKKKTGELGIILEEHYTNGPDHATKLTTDAIQAGHRNFIAIGGDGTANEVLNGLCNQQDVDLHDFMFTVLPLGTGNDWARTYKLHRRKSDWQRILVNPKISYQDVGQIEFLDDDQRGIRYYMNVAGLAYDAYVVKYIKEKVRPIKNKFVYLLNIISCLFRFKLPTATIDHCEGNYDGLVYTINAGVCKYSGGGLRLVPHAIPDDELLAITIARKIPKWNILLNMYRFYNGTIDKHRKVETHQVSELTVTPGEDQLFIEADGEFLGLAPVRISLDGRKLRIAS